MLSLFASLGKAATTAGIKPRILGSAALLSHCGGWKIGFTVFDKWKKSVTVFFSLPLLSSCIYDNLSLDSVYTCSHYILPRQTELVCCLSFILVCQNEKMPLRFRVNSFCSGSTKSQPELVWKIELVRWIKFLAQCEENVYGLKRSWKLNAILVHSKHCFFPLITATLSNLAGYFEKKHMYSIYCYFPAQNRMSS